MNGSDPPSSSTCFLIALPADLGNGRADLGRAGEGHRRDPIVGDHRRDILGFDQEGPEQACGRAGVAQDLFDHQRAFGHIAGVLEDDAIARGQCRRGKAEELPERIIPRHHRQHHAQRIEHHRAFAGRRGDGFVSQENRRLLGVVIAIPGAFLDFAFGLDQRLAHFAHDHLGKARLAGAQHLGDARSAGRRAVRSAPRPRPPGL